MISLVCSWMFQISSSQKHHAPAGNRLKLLKEITNQPLTPTGHTHTQTHTHTHQELFTIQWIGVHSKVYVCCIREFIVSRPGSL